MENFVNAIAHEVKQEIADRYFGFRTRTEIEIRNYQERLHNAQREISARIRLNILRMHFLLHRPELFESFLLLTGLPKTLVDETSRQHPSAPSVDLFVELKSNGFTRWQKYRNLAFRVYQALADDIAAYRKASLDLKEEYEEISTRIKEFHRNNDLPAILSFLRSLDSANNERLKFLHATSSPSSETGLDQDLTIELPCPVEQIMPLIADIPPLLQAKKPIIEILEAAFSFHRSSRQELLPF